MAYSALTGLLALLLLNFVTQVAPAGEAVHYRDATDCKKNEIYDATALGCVPCEDQRGLIPSPDGVHCMFLLNFLLCALTV